MVVLRVLVGRAVSGGQTCRNPAAAPPQPRRVLVSRMHRGLIRFTLSYSGVAADGPHGLRPGRGAGRAESGGQRYHGGDQPHG